MLFRSLAGIGISTCPEPSGGNSSFEVLFNPKNETTTWMDSCLVHVDLTGAIIGVMNTSTSGQGHETLVSTALGEVLERDPAGIRVPTLLVVGDRDADTPPHMARGYFERLVNAPCRRMVVIGDGTHNLMIERQRMQLFREVQLFMSEGRP